MVHIDGRREGSEDLPPGRCGRCTVAGADEENFQQCAQYRGTAGEWTGAKGVVLTAQVISRDADQCRATRLSPGDRAEGIGPGRALRHGFGAEKHQRPLRGGNVVPALPAGMPRRLAKVITSTPPSGSADAW
jgi:hypothetical protein